MVFAMHCGKVIYITLLISEIYHTGCPEKNEPQFLLNISGYKHARKLGHNSLERWDP